MSLWKALNYIITVENTGGRIELKGQMQVRVKAITAPVSYLEHGFKN